MGPAASSIILGIICAIVADSRGRSAVGWFFIGCFLSCIGLIVLLVLPDLKVMERRDHDLHQENRRLREKIRRDRVLADSRHSETMRRIDVHDDVLQIDTATPPLLELEGEVSQQDGDMNGQPDSKFDNCSWWYADPKEARQVGPVTFDSLRQLWLDDSIGKKTLVWCEEFSDWEKIGDVWDLEERLDA